MESKVKTNIKENKWDMFIKKNQIGMVLIISAGLFILNVIINPKSFNINAFLVQYLHLHPCSPLHRQGKP